MPFTFPTAIEVRKSSTTFCAVPQRENNINVKVIKDFIKMVGIGFRTNNFQWQKTSQRVGSTFFEDKNTAIKKNTHSNT
jgi:hypothetical protein